MRKFKKNRFTGGSVCLFAICMAAAFLTAAPGSSFGAVQTRLATGLQVGVGVALDELNNQLYYVEYLAGTLKRIDLPPSCGIPSMPACAGTIVTVADGLSKPEDVALDLDNRLAYVTTRDAPGSGGLWRIPIPPDPITTTGSKMLVTFNLGAPSQLVLDASENKAYVVCLDHRRLREIDLTTGVKIPIVAGLHGPVGLAVTRDGTRAYVTEQDAPARVSVIDLTTKTKLGVVVGGFTRPFYLAWADRNENALYVVERDPINRIHRLDLLTASINDTVTSLPTDPSGIAVSANFAALYTAAGNELVKADLIDLEGPVFKAVGNVPATSIKEGYATTEPGYFYKVRHSPFGKTLNIFGNLANFRALGATHYKVEISKNEGSFEALKCGWNVYKWNTSEHRYKLTPVAPDSDSFYRIPLEDDDKYHPELWHPSFLFMRWKSGENGLYEFRVRLKSSSGDIPLPTGDNSLILRIDNTKPDVLLTAICQDVAPGPGSPGSPDNPCDSGDKEVMPCDISDGVNSYYFKVRAYDANHHLFRYYLEGSWGNNKRETLYEDHYDNHEGADAPHRWSGVFNYHIPRTPPPPEKGGNPDKWSSKCDCAHTFHLRAWKRTINGYDYVYHNDWSKSVTLNNLNTPCSPK